MTETGLAAGTSLLREGNTAMTSTPSPAIAAELAGLSDEALIARTHDAWVAALTLNAFGEIRTCQAEALRRGKSHLYDQGYITFWLGTTSSAPEAA